MKKSTKEDITYISLPIGFILLFFAVIHYYVITSDIPVTFTAAEALVAQGMVFASTVAFILGSLWNPNEKVRLILLVVLSILFIMNLSGFVRDTQATYFTPEFVQLTLPFVVQPLLIIAVNIGAMIDARKKRKRSFVE